METDNRMLRGHLADEHRFAEHYLQTNNSLQQQLKQDMLKSINTCTVRTLAHTDS